MADVDIDVDAAATKQVDVVEYNSFEAIKTNVLGVQHVIKSALQAGVETVVNVSTIEA